MVRVMNIAIETKWLTNDDGNTQNLILTALISRFVPVLDQDFESSTQIIGSAKYCQLSL